MMAHLKTWLSGRSEREQWLLGVAAGLALLVLCVFGIAMPVYAAIGSAEKELDAAILRRGAIEAVVASAEPRYVAIGNNITPSGVSLEAVVTDTATAGGFEITGGTAIGVDEYQFRLASTKSGALLGWLTNLENQGIELAQISVRGGEGGFVSADVRVRRKL